MAGLSKKTLAGVLALVFALGTSLFAIPAQAQVDGGCGADIGCGVVITPPPNPGGGGGGSGGGNGRPSSVSPIRWVWYFSADSDPNNLEAGSCDPFIEPAVPGATRENYGYYLGILVDTRTGEQLDRDETCGFAADPPGDPFPPPPSEGQIFDAVEGRLNVSGIMANPGNRGMTGLETTFEAAGVLAFPGGAPMVDTGTWEASASIISTDYAWSFGDGHSGPNAPSATHTYVKKGDLTVTLTITWTIQYTIIGPIGQPITGTFRLSQTRSRGYPVIKAVGRMS